MNAYGNVHLALEAMRIRALQKTKENQPQAYGADSQDTEPPRVLVLGPENSGKTSLVKILLNYATRAAQDWSPMLVNIDPGEVTTVRLSLFTSSSHIVTLGCFYATRYNICGSHSGAVTDVDSCAYVGSSSDNSSYAYDIKLIVTSRLLVWSCRGQAQSSPARSVNPESWRKRLGQA